jgi:spore maturation protein CgeB
MKLVIFGLTISSSWGNGHATLWRGLCRALARRGHRVIFFERDVLYYAAHRDLLEIPNGELCLYPSWDEVRLAAVKHVTDADAAMVTSYCPDGIAAAELVLSADTLRVFYDLDTPVTLDQLRAGHSVSYIGPRGLVDFDLVLSYTGGRALSELKTVLGARRTAPLYGSVDPEAHHPAPVSAAYASDISYLGTYAADRQAALQKLFVDCARMIPNKHFLIGGAMYPPDFPWTENIFFVKHVPPQDHPAFFCSSPLTLNVTRSAMAEFGYCPSGRLFEAAACGAPVISDFWEGLDQFYTPGAEILIARDTTDTAAALQLSSAELRRISQRARERTLAEHTAERRAIDLESLLSQRPINGNFDGAEATGAVQLAHIHPFVE